MEASVLFSPMGLPEAYVRMAWTHRLQRRASFVGGRNCSKFSGYEVAFVPFANGKPTGPYEDFLTGFIADEAKSEVYGRPVGVAVAADGSLLVADDGNGANIIWKVSYKK